MLLLLEFQMSTCLSNTGITASAVGDNIAGINTLC